MSRSSDLQRNGPILVGLFLAAFLGVACLRVAESAQATKSKKGADPAEKKTGTLAEVEKKGKAATLTIEESDGEKFEVMVTAKTNFIVNGKGDIGFFKHGNMFVSSDEIVRNPGNNYLHGRKFKIYLGGKGPGEHFEQDPMNAELYRGSGPVVDADDESFTFEAPGGPYKVAFDQGAVEVSVESTDPEHAKVGAPVEVEGTSRAGKFHPTAIVVKLDKPMSAAEVFSGNEKKGKGKAGSKTTSKKGTAKNDKSNKGDDSPAADNNKPGSNDPFGVNSGDSGKKDKDKDAKKPKPAPKKDKKSADGDMN